MRPFGGQGIFMLPGEAWRFIPHPCPLFFELRCPAGLTPTGAPYKLNLDFVIGGPA
jgi:hypothetical protein